jgi:hypothetical protein
MESDFDLADLLHTRGVVSDYRHRLIGIDPKPDGLVDVRTYVIESRRRDGTGGKVVHWIAVDHKTPIRREFHTVEGTLSRVIRYGDIRKSQGRWFPFLWTALRAGAKGDESRIEVRQVQFDLKFPDGTFSTTNLRSAD